MAIVHLDDDVKKKARASFLPFLLNEVREREGRGGGGREMN